MRFVRIPTVRHPRLLLIAVALVVAGAVAAALLVTREDPTESTAVGDPTLVGATKVSDPTGGVLGKPTGPVVLTLKNVARPNVGKDLRLDMAQLESLGVWSYQVNDRQATGKNATFSGPLLRDVLKAAGVTASTIQAEALNDYKIDIPVSDADKYPVLVATKIDGARMSVANYGPTRVIYPTEDYDLAATVYDARWIWQLKSLAFS